MSNDRLVKFLKKVIDEGSAVIYHEPEDDCGSHSCCGNMEYEDHAPDCYILEAKSLLKEYEK